MDSELAARGAATEPSMLETSTASEPPHAPEAGDTRPVSTKQRRSRRMVPPHPAPPPELAGKWVAWSRRRIVASGETLAEVVDRVDRDGIKGASYQLLPGLIRGH